MVFGDSWLQDLRGLQRRRRVLCFGQQPRSPVAKRASQKNLRTRDSSQELHNQHPLDLLDRTSTCRSNHVESIQSPSNILGLQKHGDQKSCGKHPGPCVLRTPRPSRKLGQRCREQDKFNPCSSRDAHIMLQLKRTLEATLSRFLWRFQQQLGASIQDGVLD